MRVPDETEYKAGELHIEDRKGWVYCCHCTQCPINHQNAIYTDGRFWCSFINKWKKGDDLFEYRCPGYRQKQCSNCRSKFCTLKKKNSSVLHQISYCNSYVGTYDKQYRYYGRRVAISDKALESEQRYIKQKEEEYRKDNELPYYKGSGIAETGEYQEEETGDERVERVQISDSDKEDQIDFTS